MIPFDTFVYLWTIKVNPKRLQTKYTGWQITINDCDASHLFDLELINPQNHLCVDSNVLYSLIKSQRNIDLFMVWDNFICLNRIMLKDSVLIMSQGDPGEMHQFCKQCALWAVLWVILQPNDEVSSARRQTTCISFLVILTTPFNHCGLRRLRGRSVRLGRLFLKMNSCCIWLSWNLPWIYHPCAYSEKCIPNLSLDYGDSVEVA